MMDLCREGAHMPTLMWFGLVPGLDTGLIVAKSSTDVGSDDGDP